MAIHVQKLQHVTNQAKTLEPIRVAAADVAQAGVIDPGAVRVGMSMLEIRTSARRREAEPVTVVGAGPAGLACATALAKKLVAEHGGKVPDSREGLETLPGVGHKTANVVLNVAFGQSTIGIDTHIFRVANRTGLAPGKTPLDVELTLERVVPERYQHNCHHWLILHGRYVCKARKPECWRCIIADICLYQPKTLAPA